MSLEEVVGLALSISEFLSDSVPPVETPGPDNVEVAHNTAHIGVGDEEEEEVIDESEEVEGEVWESALTVGNYPEGYEVGEVGGSEHVDHEDFGQLVANCLEILGVGVESSVRTGKMTDHDTK